MSARVGAAGGSWLERVGEDSELWRALADDARFAAAAEWFDVTFVLEAGEHAMFIKLYRGRVIDRGRGHGFQGYAFALSATEATWAEVVASGSKGLQRALTAGALRVRGNLIEFNRAIKVVSLLVDHLARSGAGPSA